MFSLRSESRILVTGANGLIGSACVNLLKARGFTNVLAPLRSELELRDASAVVDYFKKHRPEAVLFCAARVGGIVANRDFPADFITQNLQITVNAITAAHETGVGRFLLFGSSCMYPKVCAQPMNEDLLWTGKPEETSLPFAAAKLAGVQMALAYNAQYKRAVFLPVVLNNSYGPRDNFDPVTSHMLSALITKFHDAKVREQGAVTLWGTGTPRRELVYSDDVAEACLLLLERPEIDFRLPINMGPGEDHSIREIAQIIAGEVGFSGDIEFDASFPDGAARKLLDSSHLHEMGWKPKVSLEEGIRRTYHWYLKEKP